MGQSFFALLALMLMINITFSLNRGYLYVQVSTVQRELYDMAQSVAVGGLELARELPFDQAVVDGTASSQFDPAVFTMPDQFGLPDGEICQMFSGTATCDDLDDLHNQSMIFYFPTGTDSVRFRVSFSVSYVIYDEVTRTIQGTSASPTPYKLVEVSVVDEHPSGIHIMSAPARLSRVFSYLP